MGPVISKGELVEDGRIEFQFSDLATIYFAGTTTKLHIEIRENFSIKSKYTMIMLKLIEAKRFGSRNTINIKNLQ